ncbi:quinon protein alcohol dehydrogenase-like superfamily [Xylariaceae sp. FL0804]|nr:quinon protein alcohol dehydrogenase-like superfamily [Xylariaceae sp. FL0804]
MDIHRCRFVRYPSSAINDVAFSHRTVSKASAPVRLAIGRANGDIEIWNPLAWHQETILRGGKDRSIDSLVWVTEPNQTAPDGSKMAGRSRLFSIGYTSTVTEWDLERGCPKSQASGMHGDLWCLAAQPFVVPPKKGNKDKVEVVQTGRRLVAGTMDGSLVLYSIDDDGLRFDRVLVRSSAKKTKMVSIAFRNRNIVVVGCSDSSIRIYDMRNGSTLAKMTLGSDLTSGAKEIIVWSVKCLEDGDIASGDSTGQVCIWDGKTYTQAQRLQSHNQDVLSLATSADGSTLISGGMDRRTVVYRKTGGSGSRWAKMWHRRYHDHDVKTMASFEGHGMSVVVSGGPDASPIVMPLQKAGIEEHRRLPYLPQSPPIRSARQGRIFVVWWNREVRIWRLKRSKDELWDSVDFETDLRKNRKLLKLILIKGEANITSADISEDASLLVVSTTSDIKIFHLRTPDETNPDELEVSTLKLPSKVASQGAIQVRISPDSQWLCLIQGTNTVSLLRISTESDAFNKPTFHPEAIRLQRIRRQVPKHITHGGLGQYDRTINVVAFTPDSRMLAVADLAGYIDTWVVGPSQSRLQNGVNGNHNDASGDDSSDSEEAADNDEGSNDSSSKYRWMRNPNAKLIPKLHAAPTVLSFSDHVPSDDPSDDYHLLAISAKPQMLVIQPTLGALSPWSRRNLIGRFPMEFRNIRDLVKGAVWAGDRVWVYGVNFLFMFDLTQDFPEPSPEDPSSGTELGQPGKKRKRGPDSGAGSRILVGAAGPTRISRHVQGEDPEELPIDGPVDDPMDEDEDTQAPGASDDDDDDEEGQQQGELALLRSEQQGNKPAAADDDDKSGQPHQGAAFWHIYRYRPILGIVPLGREIERQINGVMRKVVDVALVERPPSEPDAAERAADAEF